MDPALEQRVHAPASRQAPQPRPAPRLRLGWAVAGLAAVLLVAALLTPLGQTAVASFMAVFNLGRTEVRITPVDAPSPAGGDRGGEQRAVGQTLTLDRGPGPGLVCHPTAGLPAARLPAGDGADRYTYPDLPAWMPQPFSVELVYGDDRGQELHAAHLSHHAGRARPASRA